MLNICSLVLLIDQVLKTQLKAKGKGYSDVLYLDAVENKYVEEVSSCNIFMVKVCCCSHTQYLTSCEMEVLSDFHDQFVSIM